MQKKDLIVINPYLTFGGNCRDAMEFYRDCLSAKLETLPFEGSPVEVPDGYKDKTMHATLRFGSAVIMASDGMPGKTFSFGDGISISLATNNLKKATKWENFR